MTMWKCEKCGEYKFEATERCNCRLFTVVDEDGEESEIMAIDEEGAALKFAEVVKTMRVTLLENLRTSL